MTYSIEGHKVICDNDVEKAYLELWIGDKGYGNYICPRCKSVFKVYDHEFVEEPNENPGSRSWKDNGLGDY